MTEPLEKFFSKVGEKIPEPLTLEECIALSTDTELFELVNIIKSMATADCSAGTIIRTIYLLLNQKHSLSEKVKGEIRKRFDFGIASFSRRDYFIGWIIEDSVEKAKRLKMKGNDNHECSND